MKFMKDPNITFKNSLPLQFYALRGLLLGGLIFLVLIHIHYFYLSLYFVFAFFFSLNQNNYIIDVDNDSFNLILPSIYGSKFTETQTYFFNEISSFEFEKGYYDWKAAILGEVFRLAIPVGFMGPAWAYKKPKISFTLKTEKKISVDFSYNQDSLMKAIELINEKVNHANQSRNKSAKYK
jgi:hypothetical protein